MEGMINIKKLKFLTMLKRIMVFALVMASSFSCFLILESPIQAFAATTITTSEMNARTGTSSGPGVSWTTTENIAAEDNNFASVNISKILPSAYLRGTNYDFSSIPKGAIIDEITVTIRHQITNQYAIKDKEIFLINKQGNVVGPNKAQTTIFWLPGQKTGSYSWPAKDLSDYNLSLDDIKSPNFGVVLSISSQKDTVTANVDYMQISVTYTLHLTLSTVSIASNNPNPSRAKEGDTVTLSFTASETAETPAVTIAGHTPTLTNTSSNSWRAEYTMCSSDTEGGVAFSITFNDSSGNACIPVTATTNASSVVFDKTKPVITLNGDAAVTMEAGQIFTDPGATATDNYDGDITAKIVKWGIVDTSKAGSYTVTYDVEDNTGNNAVQAVRTIIVQLISPAAISLDTNVIKANVTDTYGKMYFLSTATVPEGCKLTQCGVILSKDIHNGFDINNKLVILQAPQQNSKGQFYSVFNVIYNRTIYVKSYLIYEDAYGVQKTVYSNLVTVTMTKQ